MSELIASLQAFPRAKLLAAATPLQSLANLDARLRDLPSPVSKPRLHLKRDDISELAFGGNKLRQLEFYLGDAKAKHADTILITGAVQSNFVRLAAAAACKLGLACHVQLEQRVQSKASDTAYQSSGNVVLNRMLGATIHYYPDGEDEQGADAELHKIAAQLRNKGQSPYVIPLAPGHPPLGALGYIHGALELLNDLDQYSLSVDEIIVASGSGHTHAGLLFGLRAAGSKIPVTGICVRRASDRQHPRIVERCQQIADLLKLPNPVTNTDVVVDDRFLPPGYGYLNDTVNEAMQLIARTEGVIVDPVYTGRTMAGFVNRFRESGGEASLLAIHTGGTPGVFAYFNELGNNNS